MDAGSVRSADRRSLPAPARDSVHDLDVRDAAASRWLAAPASQERHASPRCTRVLDALERRRRGAEAPHTAPARLARAAARPRARGSAKPCCLACRKLSCSSSTTTTPSSRTGAKSAERAPTTTAPRRGAGAATRRPRAARSVMRAVEHRDVHRSARLKRVTTVCGVSAISGTSTIAPRPRRQHLGDHLAGRPRSCPSP
jgi:hypothetical protein